MFRDLFALIPEGGRLSVESEDKIYGGYIVIASFNENHIRMVMPYIDICTNNIDLAKENIINMFNKLTENN